MYTAVIPPLMGRRAAGLVPYHFVLLEHYYKGGARIKIALGISHNLVRFDHAFSRNKCHIDPPYYVSFEARLARKWAEKVSCLLPQEQISSRNLRIK